MGALITLSNVKKSYKLSEDVTVEALRGINLKINEGEFVAITGPSGSGKSTLMHLIGILDKPSFGEVNLNGNNIANLTEEKLASSIF